MPAINADTLKLPKIPAPHQGATPRRVVSLTRGPTGFEGEGFPVRRSMAGVVKTLLDPFIMMDEMGAVDYGPGEPRGTDWHPHRGFETVTYIIDGTFQHQDSSGGGGLITDGATQWMTAGRGILHIETPPEELVVSGGLFHGLQLWVNLPAKDKMIAPAYQNIDADKVVLLSSPDGGALIRVIAGDVAGHSGPGNTHTPISMLHISLFPEAKLELNWDSEFNSLVYVLAGAGLVGKEDVAVRPGDLAVLVDGDYLSVTAKARKDFGDESASGHSSHFELIVLGGVPIREPVAQYGPFVMNTQSELAKAVDDYQHGRFGVVPPNALRPFKSNS